MFTFSPSIINIIQIQSCGTRETFTLSLPSPSLEVRSSVLIFLLCPLSYQQKHIFVTSIKAPTAHHIPIRRTALDQSRIPKVVSPPRWLVVLGLDRYSLVG
jgi:hypothetical protein